jgi:hypothetical protein
MNRRKLKLHFTRPEPHNEATYTTLVSKPEFTTYIDELNHMLATTAKPHRDSALAAIQKKYNLA